jgi:hypothetical protein
MQLTTNDAQRVLKKLAFEVVECKHHVRGFLIVDGKKLFPVHYSFGKKDLPGDIPHRFRRSLNLSLQEFGELVGCSIDRTKYLALLREKGILDH